MAILISSTESTLRRGAIEVADPSRPTTGPDLAPSPLRIARAWTRSTPGWLRLFSATVALLILLAVVLGIVVTTVRRSGTTTVRSTAGGALIDAQSLAVSLSDADTSAAGAYLSSGASSSELDSRYRDDLAEAAAALSRLSSQATSASDQAQLEQLTTDLPIFAGLVETARVDVAEGKPVGAAYLGEANSLVRSSMLPAVDQLYQDTKDRLQRADTVATDNTTIVATIAMFGLAIIGLVLLQWRLSRRFRRTLNLPMVLATVLVLIAAGWTTAALITQGRAVDQARHKGSDPIATLTEARIQAQELRADDELTLVTRDTNPAYQKDYATTAAELDSTLTAEPDGDVIGSTRATAAAIYAALQDVHQRIRTADTTTGQPAAAIALAGGAGETDQPQVADHLQSVLAAGVSDHVTQFDTIAMSAIDDVWGLVVGLLLLGVGAMALVILGARSRLSEYR